MALYIKIFSLLAPATSNSERRKLKMPTKMPSQKVKEWEYWLASTIRQQSFSIAKTTLFKINLNSQLFTDRATLEASREMGASAQQVMVLP